MRARLLLGSLASAGIALTLGQVTATALPGDGGAADAQAGPDVIVGAILFSSTCCLALLCRRARTADAR